MSTSSSASFVRPGDRAADSLRPVSIELGAQKYAEGSALVSFGDTRVLVAASVERRVPSWRAESGCGWVTAEYSMLPRATHTRNRRASSSGRPSARSLEIQRLVGRSLRAAVDLSLMPDTTVTLDCDVIQADGGTRTASITGAYVALVEALAKVHLEGHLAAWPMARQIAAVSVGIVGDQPLLDLEYVEDSAAAVDMNVVATRDGELIEIQGTGEERSFTRAENDALLDLALAGIDQLAAVQDTVLAPTLGAVAALAERGRQRVAPRDERELWGRPGR